MKGIKLGIIGICIILLGIALGVNIFWGFSCGIPGLLIALTAFFIDNENK